MLFFDNGFVYIFVFYKIIDKKVVYFFSCVELFLMWNINVKLFILKLINYNNFEYVLINGNKWKNFEVYW